MRSSGLDWKGCCARKPNKFRIMVAHTVFALPICTSADFYPEMTRNLQFNSDQLPSPLLPAALLGSAVRALSARLLRSLSVAWGWRQRFSAGGDFRRALIFLLRELRRFCVPQREGGL